MKLTADVLSGESAHVRGATQDVFCGRWDAVIARVVGEARPEWGWGVSERVRGGKEEGERNSPRIYSRENRLTFVKRRGMYFVAARMWMIARVDGEVKC